MNSASIIAATFGWDVSEVRDNRYQSTRTAIAIFTAGDNYYCCAKRQPTHAKTGLHWHEYKDQFWARKHNTVMWESSSADEHEEIERSPLAKEYKVAKRSSDGRMVIMLRKFNVVVAEFADNTAHAVDVFTDLLGT